MFAVRTAAKVPESSLLRVSALSNPMIGRPFRSSDEIRLRSSSSWYGSVWITIPSPVATIEIRFASSPLPLPGVGASIRCNGVGPSTIWRTNGRRKAAIALAQSA